MSDRAGLRPEAWGVALRARSSTLQPRWRTTAFPLLFFTCYMLVTVTVFEYGPWPWEVPNRPVLYGFLSLSWISLGLGFLSARKRRPSLYAGRWGIPFLAKLSLSVNLLLLGPTVYYQSSGVSLGEAIARPGDVYNRTQERAAEALSGHGTPVGYVVVYGEALTGPICYLLLPLALVFRRQLPGKLVALCVSVALAKLIVPLLLGVNKGLFDFVMLLPWCLWLGRGPGERGVTARRAVIPVALFAFLFGLVAIHLARNVSTRAGKDTLDDYYGSLHGAYREDTSVLRLLPDSWRAVFIANGSYGVQGYYGLALCLEEPFEWTFGLGHSLFLARNLDRLTGTKVFDRTYPARAEVSTGYPSLVRWHTMFPWLASDLSFPGVIALLFLIGRLLAASWTDVLLGENPFAVGMFCQLVTMMFYLPANNQLFQTLTSLVTFWGIAFLWASSRCKARQR